MAGRRRPQRDAPPGAAPGRDRGAVDVSIQMLFGLMASLAVLLLVFEATAYWHARNVFDDAAAEGARVAAAFDGTCTAGIAAAQRMVAEHAGNWGSSAQVTCTDGPLVTVTVTGTTPGVLAGSVGLRTSVSESAPKEQ